MRLFFIYKWSQYKVTETHTEYTEQGNFDCNSFVLQRVIYPLPTLCPLRHPPPLLFVPAFLTCSFDPSMFLPLPLHSGARRIQKKEREREKEFFLGRGRACTIRHSRFNLTSHLCRCETSEPAAVEPHQSGPLLGLCADSADVSRLFVSLLSSRGCKCHWRHGGGPIKSFYRYTPKSVPILDFFLLFSHNHLLSLQHYDECEYRIVCNLIGTVGLQ